MQNTNRTFLELRPETDWADGGLDGLGDPQDPIFVPFLDGDYSVGLDDPPREQNHVVGDEDAQYIVQDVRNLAGDLKVGLWPHLWKTLSDWALIRTNGELASYAARWTIPGIESRVHTGLMVNQLTLDGANAGDLMMTLGLIGSHELTEAEASYPGTGGAPPDHLAYVVPQIASTLFKNARFIISLNAGGINAFTNRISPVGLESFRITLSNNLKVGPAVEDRISVARDGRVQFLVPGRRKVDLTYTAAFDRLAYSTLQRNRLYTQFKIVGAHPHKASYLEVDAGGALAGTNVVIPLTTNPTGIVAVNDYVLFDNYGGANLECVAKVTAVQTGPNQITVDVLDENVAAGDHIFNSAFEYRTAPAIVQSSTPDKPFDDFLKVTINAQIFSGGATPLTFKGRDMTL